MSTQKVDLYRTDVEKRLPITYNLPTPCTQPLLYLQHKSKVSYSAQKLIPQVF